jgi:hypothetical protein
MEDNNTMDFMETDLEYGNLIELSPHFRFEWQAFMNFRMFLHRLNNNQLFESDPVV